MPLVIYAVPDFLRRQYEYIYKQNRTNKALNLFVRRRYETFDSDQST